MIKDIIVIIVVAIVFALFWHLLGSALRAHAADELAIPLGAIRVEQHTATCPSLFSYYLDDYDLDGDGQADIRVMGRLSVRGVREAVRVKMLLERGLFGLGYVLDRGQVREVTALEFWGRWRSPCDLLR